ncbi:MAG: NAD(P)-dependent oxidoreductase, partial [Flavobacteriales bacterium CG_4_9_14_0_2_um_filter_32_27]
MNKIVLITGATSGFGKATAKLFAQNGCHIIVTGRRKDKLIDLADKLIDRYNVRSLPLCFDVRNAEETANAIA